MKSYYKPNLVLLRKQFLDEVKVFSILLKVKN